MGIDLSGDPVCGGDDSAAGDGGSAAGDSRCNHAGMGVGTGVSSDAAAVGGGICAGNILLPDRPRVAFLGGAIRGIGTGSAADRDGADVHSGASLDDGTAEDQPVERARIGSGRGWSGDADGSGVDGEGFGPAWIAGRAAGKFVVVLGRGDFAAAEAAFGRAGADGVADDLRRGDVADRGRDRGGVSADALGEHLDAIVVWAGISNHVWIGGGVYGLHMAVAAGTADAGGNAYVRESDRCRSAGMVSGARAADDAGGAGISGDSRSNCADPAGGADGECESSGGSAGSNENQGVAGMRVRHCRLTENILQVACFK